MSDIVERLRAEASDNKRYLVPDGLALEAADIITTLRAEVEKLRAALKKIAKVTYGSDWTWGSEELADYYSMRFFNAQETARAALGEEKKG